MNNEIKEILKILKECEFGACITKHNSRVLLDYITNLQQRCEYLERSNNRREDEIMSLRDECVDGDTYKSRNEKAIEKINCLIEVEKKETNYDRFFSDSDYEIKKLKDIKNTLQGENKNE